MRNTYKLRTAMSDMFDWSVKNVRPDVNHDAWLDIRRHFSELKGILDEHHTAGYPVPFGADEVLDSLESE